MPTDAASARFRLPGTPTLTFDRQLLACDHRQDIAVSAWWAHGSYTAALP